MRKIISLFLCGIILFQLFLVTGCNDKKTKYTDYSFDYFDTVTTIVGYENSKEDFDAICEKIKEQLNEYHRLYTIYNRYYGVNNLCALNTVADGIHSELKVDSKIIDMLSFSKEIYSLTGGKVNIAFGSVLSIWHNYRESGLNNPNEAKLPDITSLKEASKHTAIEDIIINKEDNTVYLSNPKTLLDVGAIAKGYAVEEIAKWMKSEGIYGYILNVGGNVRTVGAPSDGEKWKIGIENPDTEAKEEPYIAYLELNDMSLVTSGSYQRYYIVDGKKYHHIIDPDTLYPAENFLSVSVLCESSAMADALSTALFSMNLQDGKKLIKSLENTEAMWVLANGKQEFSANFKDYFSN